jgi:hypothetical protein
MSNDFISLEQERQQQQQYIINYLKTKDISLSFEINYNNLTIELLYQFYKENGNIEILIDYEDPVYYNYIGLYYYFNRRI